jgi:hypothetical protein
MLVMSLKQIVTVFVILGFLVLSPIHVKARSEDSLMISRRVDETSLRSLIDNPIIQSFDLAPDGKTLAILAVAGTRAAAPLWLVTEDVQKQHIVASRELGPSTFPSGGFVAQVLYTGDQQYLVVQDLQNIVVLDSTSLAQIRTISAPSQSAQTPVFAIGAKNRDVFAFAFGVSPKFDPHIHQTPVQIKVVDVSSGDDLGNWAAEDVPQSVSPDGSLIAVSSWKNARSVIPLAVFNTKGRKMAEIAGDFSFRKVKNESSPIGRVIGLFLDSQELILSPDQNVDQSGNHSGDMLQRVKIASKQTEETIKPHHYGPTGELAISGDLKTFVAVSWYLPASVTSDGHGVLPDSSPEILVFDHGAKTRLEITRTIRSLGLKSTGWMENRRPRLSFDGNVIAIAQDNGITVLTRKSAKN